MTRVALFLLAGTSLSHAQALPRLTGTVIAPGTRQALVDTGAGPQALGLDDVIGPWRVDSIEPGVVRLAGPGGTVSVGLDNVTTEAQTWPNPCGRLHPRIAGTHGHDRLACRTALDRTGLR